MTKECLQCGRLFEIKDSRKKFCNQSCSATFNNLKRGNKLRYCGKCANCNNDLKPNQKKFCSNPCQGQFKHKEKVEEWLAHPDMSASIAHGVLAKWARDFLLEEASNKCSRCGWCEVNPVLGYPILTVDHIDGNWANNTKANLQVLCYNCHTLTSTFNALNVGNTGNNLVRAGSGNRYYKHKERRDKELKMGL